MHFLSLLISKYASAEFHFANFHPRFVINFLTAKQRNCVCKYKYISPITIQ